jgi:putative toxin-antitoxin system antitoxin component (TIGR02293 family)
MQATLQDHAAEESVHNRPDFPGLVELLNTGVPTSAVDEIADGLGLGKGEALDLVGMSRSQLSRAGKRLGRQASERILMLRETIQEGMDAFAGDAAAFHAWFRRSNLLLGNLSPLEVCGFAIGIREVQRVLSRIRTADFLV